MDEEKENIENNTPVELVDKLPNEVDKTSEEKVEIKEDNTPKTEKKKNKLALIIVSALAVIFGVLLVVAIVLKNQKTPLENLRENYKNAESIMTITDTKYEFKNSNFSGAKTAELKFTLSSIELPADFKLEVKVYTPENDEISMGLAGKVSKEGDLFVKFSNFKNFLDDMGFSKILYHIYEDAAYNSFVASIDDEWLKMDGEDFANIFNFLSEKEVGEESNASACLKSQLSDLNLRDSKYFSTMAKSDYKDANEYYFIVNADEIEKRIKKIDECFPAQTVASELSGGLFNVIERLSNKTLDIKTQNIEKGIYSTISSSFENSEYYLKSQTEIHFISKQDFRLPDSYQNFQDLLLDYTVN